MDCSRTESFRMLKHEVAHLKNMAEWGAELQPHRRSEPSGARDPESASNLVSHGKLHFLLFFFFFLLSVSVSVHLFSAVKGVQ